MASPQGISPPSSPVYMARRPQSAHARSPPGSGGCNRSRPQSAKASRQRPQSAPASRHTGRSSVEDEKFQESIDPLIERKEIVLVPRDPCQHEREWEMEDKRAEYGDYGRPRKRNTFMHCIQPQGLSQVYLVDKGPLSHPCNCVQCRESRSKGYSPRAKRGKCKVQIQEGAVQKPKPEQEEPVQRIRGKAMRRKELSKEIAKYEGRVTTTLRQVTFFTNKLEKLKANWEKQKRRDEAKAEAILAKQLAQSGVMGLQQVEEDDEF